MITGINHLNLSVSNLEQSFNFYSNILGCKPLAKWKKGAYLLAGDLWLCLYLDHQVRSQPLPEYTHVAFSVGSSEDLEYYRHQLNSLQIKQWQKNTSEGNSLYILDPDGHKLELHVGNWKTRLEVTKQKPYQDMIFFD